MTESDWLKGKDVDAMLAAVVDRLSPRKWLLLACATVRRVWELLPEGDFRQAIVWLEDHAGSEIPAETANEWRARVDAAQPAAIEAAQAAQRLAVLGADPDADENEFRESDARRTNPAVPLFRGATHSAAAAIESAGEAVEHACAAVRVLFSHSDEPRLANARMTCVQALTNHARSGIEATLALELKAHGDEIADRGVAKNVRLWQSEAIETVNKMTEIAGNRSAELEEQKQKGDAKALARFLIEQVGNPFQDYRFESQWRTDSVVGIARAIDEDRAVDRYIFLADALLDADCDEEAILRHCRGTEKHATEPPIHFRGCWVIDLIMQHDTDVFARPRLTEARQPAPAERLGLAFPAGLFDIGLDLDDDDEDEPLPDEE